MPIVKYIAVHKSPRRLLRYITKKGKTENTLITGIQCSSDIDMAYQDMKNIYEYYSGERFHKKSIDLKPDNRKENIRLHHYIQSFKPGEVSAAEAHEIAYEWVRRTFGSRRPVLIVTHIDKGHIHNHFAVCPYDLDGNHWSANKTTLKDCREKSDEIAKLHGLSVIEHPKYRANHKYNENAKRKENTSWKQKLCDDIDEIICMPSVMTVRDLVNELKKKGYITRFGKYLSVRPPEAKNSIRTFRLGDGYALEHLQYRIEHKEREMPLSEVMKYDGIERELVMCIRQIQIEINRKPEKDRLHLATYRDVLKTLDILNFVTENDIHSAADFEKIVSKAEEKVTELENEKKKIEGEISEAQRIMDNIPKYIELSSKNSYLAKDIDELAEYNFVKHAGVKSLADVETYKNKLSELNKKLSDLNVSIDEAKSESKKISDIFNTFKENMKSDYDKMIERTKAEIEAQKEAEERIRQEKEEAEIRKQQEEYYKNYTPPSEEEWR